MKSVLIATLALLALLPVAASDKPSSVDPQSVVGSWNGQARFYEKKLADQHGPLPTRLHVGSDLTLSGRLGAATLPPTQPVRRRGRLDYEVSLQGAVLAEGHAAGKRQLVLLITSVGDGRLSGDFHLKTRFGWDPTMHPGALELERAP
ncbi:hypothetical protein [Inhella sp.]|uniref:hypothetical protein n=1 Tax=Inhella sp. TaxID=1921806 RepID=UPI0035AFD0E1